MGLSYREAGLEDAALAADLFTEDDPERPRDPVIWRHFWAHPDRNFVLKRYIAELDGKPVGYVDYEHAAWHLRDTKYCEVGAITPRAPDAIEEAYGHSEGLGVVAGAEVLTTWVSEVNPERLALVERRGYVRERVEKFWELDMVANRESLTRMAEASRERMRKENVLLVTLAEIEPRPWERLEELSWEAEQDIPTTVPHVRPAFEDFLAWMKTPGLIEDRMWVAIEGGEIVGISQLRYPPVRGFVETDWTCTARRVRGWGVARALKCETVMQAIALGVDRVRTDNDGENGPILHINESMGYRAVPGLIELHRRLT